MSELTSRAAAAVLKALPGCAGMSLSAELMGPVMQQLDLLALIDACGVRECGARGPGAPEDVRKAGALGEKG